MNLWGNAMNLNPSQLPDVRELARAGLRDEPKQYFKDIQDQYPRSSVPRRGLERLRRF